MGSDEEIERALAWERAYPAREPSIYELAQADAWRQYYAEQERQNRPRPPSSQPKESKAHYLGAFIYAFVFWRAMWNLAFSQNRGGFLSFIRKYK
jgi:hypothetical protein